MKKHERFFGLHFDFHADHKSDIGVRTDPEIIEKYIEAAKPDFIQCDCKGHAGICSYPTKVGYPAKNLKADNLRVWADVAKKHDLPLYVHYSGVWDKEYLLHHPDQAAVKEDGTVTEQVCLYGNYLDELLIPQFKELISEYGISGMWVDGDCWGVNRDFSDKMKERFPENMTGEQHDQLMHDAFLDYARKYTDELHAFEPDFQVISNWAYSSYMPEKPTVDFDCLSGDFKSENSAHAARYESRTMAMQGMPWDLMAWGFALNVQYLNAADTNDAKIDRPAISTKINKSAPQLMQEACMALTLGGGFQIYQLQTRDGSAPLADVENYRLAGEFIRKRRINYKKVPIAQVGIFYSAETRYKKGKIFNAAGSTNCMIGVVNGVLNARYTANILLEYKLDTINEYDIVIIPEWEFISDENRKKFIDYAKDGGNLLVIGTDACMQFGKDVGNDFEKLDRTSYYICENGLLGQINSEFVNLKSGKNTLYTSWDMRDDSGCPAHRIDSFGKGTIAYIPFNFGTVYNSMESCVYTDYLRNILNEISTPVVEIDKPDIDMTLQPTEDGLYVNLINMNQGRHDLKCCIYDYIPPVHDITLKIHKPAKEVVMPFGEEFSYEITDDGVIVKLKKLDIHSIIELKN
ncbi:MAG: alpha-L-fucosidase [Clostridia bacterium]|nr:alpha-L-fucosidase [Clostridia bacterium]